MWPDAPECASDIFAAWRRLRQFYLVPLSAFAAVLVALGDGSPRAFYVTAWAVLVGFLAYYGGPLVECAMFKAGVWHRAIHNAIYVLGMTVATMAILALASLLFLR